MQFGIFSHIPWPEGKSPRDMVERITEGTQLAEELGFHCVWLAEHHFSRYGIGSSSLLILSSIAARTREIRLGTAILVPPLHHPIRLAEDTATLDVISDGRLDVGFGRGVPGYEYRAFDADWEESQGRFQESISIIKGLWTNRDYSHSGKYYKVKRADLVPLPVQQPHPPVYIAASRTEATLDFAASTGYRLIIGAVLDTANAIDLCHRFVKKSAVAGHKVPMSAIPFHRYFYVAETKEQARSDTIKGLTWNVDMAQWRYTLTEEGDVYKRLDDWRKQRTELPPGYDELCEKRAIIGTPEHCIAKIKEIQNEGIEYFVCDFAFGGNDHQKVLKSMKLFAREVMPAFG